MSSSRELDTAEYLAIAAGHKAERPPEFSSLVRAELGAMTHIGRLRENNEDHFLTARFGRSLVTFETNLPEGLVPDRFEETGYALVVADGVGGAVAGEVASSLAISVGVNLALNSPKWNLIATPDEIKENMEKWRHRFRQIDYVLTERAEADPALHGMGTTLTVACSVGADLVLYYIGDSRAYLFRQGKLHRLTRDHTMAQELADAGDIAPEEVATHRLRHVLTRALGQSGGDVEAELQHLRLANGDRLLLCTDGLTDMVSDAQIAEVLHGLDRAHDAARALIDLALEAGGRDNVTVVLARYTIPEAPPGAERTVE
jgi:serine/threonine protein phosphatase PrpC